MKQYDVAVIGAGVVGAMICRELSRFEVRTVLLERMDDVCMGASRANSSIVHAGFDCEPGTLKARLNVRGSELMERVADELGVPYVRNTSLVVGFSDEDKPKLEYLLDKGIRNGVRGLKLVTSDEARALEPGLSEEVRWALLAPTGAVICPYELTIAAVGNAMDNGVELRTGFEVRTIGKEGDLYTVSSGEDALQAKYVINCAGVYADAVAAMAGAGDFTITPRRGEYMLMDKECGKAVRATVFRTPTAMGKGILVTRTVDGNLLMGPTAENIGDKEDTSTTAQGLEKVFEQARRVLPAVSMRQVITSFAGLRAVGPTGDFIINQPKEGFINCAGIESPGLSSAPAIAEYVLEMLGQSGLALAEKDRYSPRRRPFNWFRNLTPEEKDEVIRKDPAYGRMVCRCEGITEGEIRDALTQNPRPRDLDGVKRRTRAGMGRCQGGFCSPVVIELLAGELGIPYECVTKSGKGSYLMTGRTKGGRRS